MINFNSSNIAELAWEQKKNIKQVRMNKNISRYIIDSHVLILFCTIIYGAILGFYSKDIQILFNAVKIPLLFLITLYITIPIVFIVDALQGNKINLAQTEVLLLLGFNNTAVVLLAFTPLMLFFILTALDYYFIVLLNIAICGFAGYFGIFSIYQNYKTFYNRDEWPHALTIGAFIIIFVGTQLAWTLRPFFNTYTDFIRPISSNFYVALGTLIQSHPGETIVLLGIFGVIAFAVTIARLGREDEKKIVYTPNGRLQRRLKESGNGKIDPQSTTLSTQAPAIGQANAHAHTLAQTQALKSAQASAQNPNQIPTTQPYPYNPVPYSYYMRY